MIGVIFDYETNNAEPATCTPVQTGMLKFDLDTWEILNTYKSYHKEKDVEFHPLAIEKCGITQKTLDTKGKDPELVAKKTKKWLAEADVVFAHNGKRFDYPILERFLKKYGIKMPKNTIFLDSMLHINFPESIKTRALLYLCAEHNFLPKEVIPGGKAHDALSDCYALWHLLSFYREQLQEAIARANAVMYSIEACVTRETNQQAKDRKYRADYVDGKFNGWFKDIAAPDLKKELEEAPFKIAYEGDVIKKVIFKENRCIIKTE